MIIFLINNVSDMCFGLIQLATSFYIWFAKQQYQEERAGVSPPSYSLQAQLNYKIGGAYLHTRGISMKDNITIGPILVLFPPFCSLLGVPKAPSGPFLGRAYATVSMSPTPLASLVDGYEGRLVDCTNIQGIHKLTHCKITLKLGY